MQQIDLDSFVRRNVERAEAARQLQKIVTQFPELLADLVQLHQPVPDASPIARRGRRAKNTRGTAYERITRIFLQTGNADWFDTSQIVEKSGVQRNVVANVMWSVHRADFEQRPHPTHAKMKLWRLTPEAYDRLKKQNRLFDAEAKEGA